MDELDLTAVRSFCHDLADLADDVTLAWQQRSSSQRTVETKADGSPVTAADRQVERMLRESILARYPHHAVLGEEDGRVGPQGVPTWILDPIDGTKNFASGIPVWATLIALAVDDVEVVGVVSAPALEARWDGVTGGPARRDGIAITVSEVDAVADARISFGGLRYFRERGLGAAVDRLVDAGARTRGFGDFWHHCLVAEGSLDAALEAAVSRWDLAAVRVVVEAAGGRLTDLRGNATTAGGDACSSNGRVHEAILATFRA